MEARAAPRETAREVLVFVLGAEEYGVDILKVQEIRGLAQSAGADGIGVTFS